MIKFETTDEKVIELKIQDYKIIDDYHFLTFLILLICFLQVLNHWVLSRYILTIFGIHGNIHYLDITLLPYLDIFGH